eukprot:SAG22_NODE_17364_length_306_cov_0.753623_1_plen_52_part_10
MKIDLPSRSQDSHTQSFSLSLPPCLSFLARARSVRPLFETRVTDLLVVLYYF